MSGIYYALSIAAVFIVIRWFIRNDNKKPGESTTGLLAMRGQPEPSSQSSKPPAHKSEAAIPNKM